VIREQRQERDLVEALTASPLRDVPIERVSVNSWVRDVEL
jgi:hypothetical protein